jgi:ferric enterobactin receptor
MRKIILKTLIFLIASASNIELFAQVESVSGIVISDDDKTPLQNVTISIKGSKVATKTNQVGYYSIKVKAGQTLVFSYIDYVRQEIVIKQNDKINIGLIPNQKQLSEVVVTSYGQTVNKKGLAYQAQKIEGTQIAEAQRDNWINALAGRVAGANITPTSGTPGSSTSIVLRGAVSLSGSNQPLFIVDGLPIDNQTLNQENLVAASNTSGVGFGNRNSDYGNRAADINPEDIESVTILKGPEASALYGSDGASGAIVITTKKGKSGKAVVTYDNSFRREQVYLFPEIQTTYGRGINGVSNPTSTVNPYSAGAQYAYFGTKYGSNTPLFDNVKAFFKTGITQKHNINVEGGSDVSTYRFSANYLKQKGVVPTTGFERLTMKLTGTAKISPKVDVVTSFAYANSVTDKASKGAGSFLLNLLNYPSDLDVNDFQNQDGSRKLYRSTSTSLSAEYDNPLWDVNKNPAQDKIDRLTANVTLNIKPFKWLNIAAISGIDNYAQTGFFLTHPQSRFGFATNGFLSLYQQNTRNLNNVFRATARKKIGKFSNSITIGTAIDDNKTKIESQRGERFYEANVNSINNTDPLSRDAKTTIINDRKVRMFSNYTVTYNDLATVSLAASREGNSKLNSRQIEKDIYYNFGSVSFSFIFSELNVLKDLKFLNYLKGRISYGTTGKGPGSPYVIDNTFASQVTTGGGYQYGVFLNNPFLKPEYTQNFEFGGELKLFKNRLTIDVTRYALRSKDQIIAARASYPTGGILKYLNGGTVENKGIEAIVNVTIIKNKKLSWDITANFDRNRGKVISLPNGLPTYYDSDTWVYGNLRSQAYPGAPIGNLAGYTTLLNPSGSTVISATSGLPVNFGDFKEVADRQSKYRVGLINTVTYKELSLSFNLDFRRGGDVFNGNEMFLQYTGLSKRTLNRESPVIINGVLLDGYQNTTNPTQNNISVYPYYRSDYYSTSTEGDFIETVDWIRLRDATISYRLPQYLVKKQRVFKSASVFVTGTDLFIITNYTGADPSVNANNASNRGVGGAGIDYGSLSMPRGINAGFKVQF